MSGEGTASAAGPSLPGFLAARLDEDEAAANSVAGMPGALTAFGAVAEFMARTEPARVLREVTAKRVIIKQAALLARVPPNRAVALIAEDMLRHLAAVYSGHPGYRQEWKP